MKEKFRKIIICSIQEYVRKICSARFLGVAVLVVALVCSMVVGIDQLMMDTNEWITPWMAPHFFSNIYFITFYGFIVCYMYSDVPFFNRAELYKILREGRRVWCVEKMISIVLQAFTLVSFTMLVSVLAFVPKLKFEWDWGRIIYTMAFSGNMYEYDLTGTFPVIITKYTPVQAMLLCFFMVGLVSSMMGLLMFAVSLYGNRILAVSVAAVLTGLNLSGVKFITAAWLTYVLPFYWCRINIYEQQICPGRYGRSLSFYATLCSILIVVLVLAILLRSRRIEYVWNKEE